MIVSHSANLRSVLETRPQWAAPHVVLFSDYDVRISVHIVISEYGGGAHLVFGGTTFNFGLVNGKPKELKLGDLFLTGADYYRLVRSLLSRQLRKTGAPDAVVAYVNSPHSFPDYFLEGFFMGPDGLRYFFPPEAVATYAEGAFEARLTIRELGPRFRRDLLLAR